MRIEKMKQGKAGWKAFAAGAGLAFAVVLSGPALAEGGVFSPRLVINGQVVSNYEVEQRVRFLQVLRVPGDPEKEAIAGLTRDRLGMQEAKRLNIKLTAQQVTDGMSEFAARANLDTAGFVKAIADEGVDEATFRDFVTAGLLWREVVRTKFGGTVRISEVQIDRAMAEAARKPEVKLLLSELVVPVPQGGDPADTLAEVRDIKANLAAEGGFAAAARKFSASPTAPEGGRLDWMPLGNLPPNISQKLLQLGAGDVSDPIVVPQAVVLFQLNGLDDMETPAPLEVKVSYAEFTLSPDQDGAAILATVDGCDDLYPLARALPPERLRIAEGVPMQAVPADIGLALAKLDPGEGILRQQGGQAEILMLCLRDGVQPPPDTPEAAAAAGEKPAASAEAAAKPATEAPAADKAKDEAAAEFEKPDPMRESVRSQIGNVQLSAQADAYMEKLRSEAIIETP